MQPLHRTIFTLIVAVLWHWPALSHADEGEKPMNVVLILADDLGWTDLGVYGSDLYQTPNLDQLAAEGVRFTQNYSACTVCSPTRAALLTGKYPGRLRITDWIPGQMPANPKLIVPDFTKQLPLEENTLAERFKSAGYRTASIGKWHLGDEEYFPEHQGFDTSIAGTNLGSPPSGYFAPWKISSLPEGEPGEYLTDRLGIEAARWIERVKDKPFFLYLPHYAVHTPTQAPEALVEKYKAIDRSNLRQKNAIYAGMVESMDATVGLIREKLEALNLTQNTAIIFTSDNGGRVPTTSNHPLRVGKGSCYEGGTRVPMIIYWPGVTNAGRVIETPVMTIDIYPTLVEMLPLKNEPSQKVDGVSLAGLLRGDGKLAERDLFWHYPHYQHYQQGGTTPYSAIRSGDFKLIDFHDGAPVELYNLKDDLAESTNLAEEEPDRTSALREKLHAWRLACAVQMPTPNRDYDPSKPEHTPKR